MKARLVITNKTTRKSVWRVFSVVNGEPREAGAVPMVSGSDPRQRRDSERYHVARHLPLGETFSLERYRARRISEPLARARS
jgi:hypothetical protein